MTEALRFDLLATDRASAVFNKVGKAAGDTESRFSKMGSGMLALGKAAAVGIGAGMAAAGLGITKVVGLEAEFSKTMNVLAATIGDAPKRQMKDLSALAMKMGAVTTFSASDASRAMLELARGGMTAATIQGGALQGTLTLAAAGELEMGEAANIAVKSMGQFNLKGKEMGAVAAALAGGANASSASVQDMSHALAQGGLAANSVGFSIQETTGILAAFSNAGLEGSDAGTSLKTMLDRLQPTTKSASNAMKALGVITEDGRNRFIKANGEFESAARIAEVLRQGTEKLSQSESKRLITQAFGSDAQRAATILAKEGAVGIDKMTKATSDQTAAQKMAAANMKGTAGAIEAMKGSIETAGLAFGMAIQPLVKFGAEFVSNIANKAVPIIQDFGADVGKFAREMKNGTGAGGEFADRMKSLGSTLLSVGATIVSVALFLNDHRTAVTSLGVALAALVVVTKAHAAAMAVQAAGGLAAMIKGLPVVTSLTKTWAAVQWALNGALAANPIVLVIAGLVALGAGLVIAYKRSETFRDVVDGAFRVVGDAGRWLWNNALRPAFAGIEKGFEAVGKAGTWLWNNALQPAFKFIVGGVASILDMWSSMLGALAKVPGFGWAEKAATAMANAAGKAREMAAGIEKIPTSKTVYIAFKVTGLKHGADPGRNAVEGILPRGQVESESVKLGELFSKGFAGGVKAKIKTALAAVSELVSRSSERLQTLRDKAAEITGSVADAMRGALDVGSLGKINEDGTQASVTSQLGDFAAQAGQFASALATAAGNGLNSGLIQRIAQLGPTQGLTAAQALAAMDQAQVASANASMAAVDAYANQLGQTVLTTTSLPEDIARAQGMHDALLQIRDDLKNRPQQISFTVNDATDPDAVVRAIRKYIKRNGKLRDVAAD